MIQFLLWILPPVLYFLAVMFFRKQVDEPHIPRIAYWGTILMFIPIAGLIFTVVISALILAGLISGEIEFKEDTNFSKKWLD